MSTVHFQQAGSRSPEAVFDRFRDGEPGDLLAVDYRLSVYWQNDAPDESLTAIYELNGGAPGVRYCVCRRSDNLIRALRDKPADIETLARQFGVPLLDTATALPLVPVHIPKPWGEEIWYTGIEGRGVAEVGGAGVTVPLPWALSALPRRLCGGRERELILLKILAPLPDPVFGDLYFELHREKREVYVVTHVDERAWPEGEGAIRFGFCPDKRAKYDNDDAFRAAFVATVKAYEEVRREIDGLLDRCRRDEGIAPDAAVSPERTRRWLAQVPADLRERERQRRAEMESFTALLPLRVGDVVKVPTLTPHSLQHGVRTVEFQTPVYERLIVAFAQKVLTQEHWDTERAAELMQLDTPEPEAPTALRQAAGFREERIVDFADFEVRRLVLEAGAEAIIEPADSYAVCMAVQGTFGVGGVQLVPEDAALLPAGWSGGTVANSEATPLILLIAYPRGARPQGQAA